jgi:hypothetical protein
MKAAREEQPTSYDDPDQQVMAPEPDTPVSESECPPRGEDEGQTIEEPGYGHGV